MIQSNILEHKVCLEYDFVGRKFGANHCFELISDPIKFHDVPGSLIAPQGVELKEDVAIHLVEVNQGRQQWGSWCGELNTP